MNKIILAFLVATAVLAAGCPRDNYELTLTPRGDVIERTLVFYRADDSDTPPNAPRYLEFDPNELASITSFYPKTGVVNEGERHTARGEFSGELPGDIGGSGWYANLSTSLGYAGFYVERFRGSDDIYAMIEQKFQAADQLADLVIGWSNAQFKFEPGFAKLHRFLDQDLRYDLKNLGLYEWMREDLKSGDQGEEYLVRFGQYLIERGYVKSEEAPGLIRGQPFGDDAESSRWLQRLIARKMGIADEQPVPRSLEFMADPKAVENSWNNYLAGTDAYQAKLRSWEKNKTVNAQAPKPDPFDVVEDLYNRLLGTMISYGQDRLTVKLSLPSKPLRTNGKWDETTRQVVWESGLVGNNQLFGLPAFCYGDWVLPQEDFQKDHFGTVSLTGEELLSYCLWRNGLGEKKAVEWDQFLAGLFPGADAINKLNNFRFTGESEQIDDEEQRLDSDIGKELIKEALKSRQ